MKYTVIRVLRNSEGQCEHCTVEKSFADKLDAEKFLNNVNRLMSCKTLNWVLDSYVVY